MKKTDFRLLFIKVSIIVFVAVYSFVPRLAICLDVTASSLSLYDVQTAVNTVSNAGGGNVYLPAGSVVWNYVLYLRGGTNLIGYGSPNTTKDSNGKLGPTPTTIIQISTNSSWSSWSIIYQNKMDGSSSSPAPPSWSPRVKGSRVSGIRFIGWNGSTYAGSIIGFQDAPGSRLDHCDIVGSQYQTNFSNYSIATAPTIGVVDHNNFMRELSPNYQSYAIYVGERATTPPVPLGMANDTVVDSIHMPDDLTVEDNYFENIGGHQVSGFCGAHYTFRYNTVVDVDETVSPPEAQGTMDVHGDTYCNTPGYKHSGGPQEIYNNLFAFRQTKGYRAYEIYWRGRHGVIFNNTFDKVNYGSGVGRIFAEDDTGVDAPGHDGAYIPGVWIGGNTYINCATMSDGKYWGTNGTPVDNKYIAIASSCSDTNKALYGINDGVGSDHGCQKPGYTPYTYPHPLVSGAKLLSPAPYAPKNLRTINP